MSRTKNYVYYDSTTSLCNSCHRPIAAKIIFEDNKVFIIKTCKDHGFQKVLISDDIEFYKNIRNYNKASEYPRKPHTATEHGCPLDCGICPDHEQHSCLTLIEVTDRCNLTCPTCYASSSPTHGRHKSLEEIRELFETVVRSEIEPDVVQLSGGEPTVHPQFFEIMDMAKSYPIKHLMLNTNGVRIAQDKGFAERLSTYAPDFEIYLQFDSFKADTLINMRGKDLSSIRTRAIEILNALNLSTTLVVTLQKGENDDEIGKILDYASRQKCVRGVTFQPTSVSGRLENFDPSLDRMTNSEVRRLIVEQTSTYTYDDIIPVPCNPDALLMAYAFKTEQGIEPLTRYINPEDLLNNSKNTIVYEQDEDLKLRMLNMFSTGISVDAVQEEVHELMCCLPEVIAPDLGYDNIFRIIVMNFMDAYDFDVRAIKKSCVHIAHSNDKIIPFETMNLFYRPEFAEKLQKLQKQYS